MLSWMSANIGTVVISVILLCVIAAVIIALARDRKKGKSSCGCNCQNCPMGGECHKKS